MGMRLFDYQQKQICWKYAVLTNRLFIYYLQILQQTEK